MRSPSTLNSAMSARLDARYPLCAAPLPSEQIPTTESETTHLLLSLTQQAFNLVRSSPGWRKGSQYGHNDETQGGKVQTLRLPSEMKGRLKKCAWHGRLSRHVPGKCGLDFDDFYQGLGSAEHTPNESEYIHEISEVKRIATLSEGTVEIWRNSYILAKPTGNRDFVELVVTLPLPPSPNPFSSAHEMVTRDMISDRHHAQESSRSFAHSRDQRKSFMVISIPVAHPQAPERPPHFVRAKYASVEAVWESATASGANPQNSERPSNSQELNWFMAVQSDASGRIPIVFQELAMASKIAKDVPLFFKWARRRKPPASTAQQMPSDNSIA
ncbi:unnamed protein product [Sympodiomycopsis kandeliae]